MLNKLFDQYIGRVTVALTALLLPFAVTFANWVLDNTGVDLPSKDITFILVAVTLGLGAVVYKWLHNRGEYERVVLELEKLYEAGAAIAQHGQDIPTAEASTSYGAGSTSGTPGGPQDIPRRP